jgi:hypothetical protein
VGDGRSKGGRASLLGAVRVYEVMPIPSRFSCGGGVFSVVRSGRGSVMGEWGKGEIVYACGVW